VELLNPRQTLINNMHKYYDRHSDVNRYNHQQTHNSGKSMYANTEQGTDEIAIYIQKAVALKKRLRIIPRARSMSW